MNIIYDLFLNFQEDAIEFFEWNDEDDIEHIRKIPLVKVDDDILFNLLNNKIKLDKEFLNEIKDICEKYDATTLTYACVFSGDETSLAVEFDNDGVSAFKSRLLGEDEEDVLKYSRKETIKKIPYEVIEEKDEKTFFTRRERKIRNCLEKDIKKIYSNEEIMKLKYFYLEYFSRQEDDPKIMMNSLIDSMKDSLDDKHMEIYKILLTTKKKAY